MSRGMEIKIGVALNLMEVRSVVEFDRDEGEANCRKKNTVTFSENPS